MTFWTDDDAEAFIKAPRQFVKQDAAYFMQMAFEVIYNNLDGKEALLAAQVWATLAQAAATRQLALTTERNGRSKGGPT